MRPEVFYGDGRVRTEKSSIIVSYIAHILHLLIRKRNDIITLQHPAARHLLADVSGAPPNKQH
jgi:hypothetical protein